MTEALLTEDNVADIIYCARAGDLEDLTALTSELTPEEVPELKDAQNSTPLHMACANGHVACVQLLLSVLLRLGLTNLVNAANDSKNTPLHWAVLNGHLEIVKLLCEAGADPFAKNEAGHDAFYEAELNQKEEIIDFLLLKYSVEPEEDDDEVQDETNGEAPA